MFVLNKTLIFLRRLARGLMLLFSIMLLIWIVAVQAGCFTMRTPDSDWPEALRQKGQLQEPVFYNIPDPAGRRIHAIGVSESDTLPLAVFVHGSPGSADAYLPYLADTALSRRFRLLSIDRPGFGYTQGFGKPERSMEKQAAAVKAVADSLAPGEKIWLIGHSLGGPVIARFAMDYPGQTAGLILVAASVDPALEPHPWWQSAIDPPPLKWLIPKSLWASNAEIRPLEGELKKMLPFWERIKCPVRVLHAQDDRLVPVANVAFMERVLARNPDLQTVILPEGDHFILWSRTDLVGKALIGASGILQEKN